MADNLTSFNRFTTLPANIAAYGATVEEFELQRGQPDVNPMLSPMASPRVTAPRLALQPSGSDNYRLGEPLQPSVNPYEGPKKTLVLSRSAVQKLSGNVVSQLQATVEQIELEGNLQARMLDSIRRVVGLRDYLHEINAMTELVYVRSLAASKG